MSSSVSMAPSPLPFQKAIVADIHDGHSLVCIAAGLGLPELLSLFIVELDLSNSLLVVFNAPPTVPKLCYEYLKAWGCSVPIRTTENISTVTERTELYAANGVVFARPQLLLADVLSGRAPLSRMHNVLVYNAHAIDQDSSISFAIRSMRRCASRDLNVRGITDSVLLLANGVRSHTIRANVEGLMQQLGLKRLCLYPRFLSSISTEFASIEPEVIELMVPLTDNMKELQNAVIRVLDVCLLEIKRMNTFIDLSSISVEESLFRSFHGAVRGQLEAVWHKCGPVTRQLVSDLRILSKLLHCVTSLDAVTFYTYVESLHFAEFGDSSRKPRGGSRRPFSSELLSSNRALDKSLWMQMDEADKLFAVAKRRVYKSRRSKRKRPTGGSGSADDNDALTIDVQLEPQPKWTALLNLLDELKAEHADSPPSILIVVDDESIAEQLVSVIGGGVEAHMQRMFEMYLTRRTTQLDASRATEEDRALSSLSLPLTSGGAGSSAGASTTMGCDRVATGGVSGTAGDTSESDAYSELSRAQRDRFSRMYGEIVEPTVTVVCATAFPSILATMQPSVVILYDVQPHLIRMLEVFQVAHCEIKLRVYVLSYSSSVDEQRFLALLRKEQECFSELIRHESRLNTISEFRPVATSSSGVLPMEPTMLASNRKGGSLSKPKEPVENIVVIDTRELRSMLPSVLDRKGLTVALRMLTIGDYILTPDVCVERKSVPDLFGSLNSGRLFTQCTYMMRAYKTGVLLIEFDDRGPFHLLPKNELGRDLSPMSVHAKLSVLLLAFPDLRILWARHPFASARLFAAIKDGHSQPNPEACVLLGTDSDPSGSCTDADARDADRPDAADDNRPSEFSASSDVQSESANATVGNVWNLRSTAPVDLLMTMPGITEKNVRSVTRNCSSLYSLCTASIEDIYDWTDASDANQLHSFLNEQTF